MSHNQISLAINSLQYQWSDELCDKTLPLIRWMIKDDETSLINGFFQVESTSNGECDDFFLSLFTPFISGEGEYSNNLVSDFLDSWNNDKSISNSSIIWDNSYFSGNLGDVKKADNLFVEMLSDLKDQFCSDSQRLTFILLPSQIDSIPDFNKWLLEMCPKLTKGVSICIVDYIGVNNFGSCIDKLDVTSTITLMCGRFDINKIASGIVSSQQDSQKPEIIFQNCILKMGDATLANNKSSLQKWGDEAVRAARLSGSISFVATAYLVYAGFLMHFKDKIALEKLNKGEKLAETAVESDDEMGRTVLMQIYGYKSAYYSIMRNKQDATIWSLKQARYAAYNSMDIYAITMYRHTAQLALRCDNELYRCSLSEGYKVSEEVSDKELESSEIRTIASHYIDLLQDDGDKELADNITVRMSDLFGESWRDNISSLKDKYSEIDFTKPIKVEKSV